MEQTHTNTPTPEQKKTRLEQEGGPELLMRMSEKCIEAYLRHDNGEFSPTEVLLSAHSHFIENVMFMMDLSRDDAEFITKRILVSKLSQLACEQTVIAPKPFVDTQELDAIITNNALVSASK